MSAKIATAKIVDANFGRKEVWAELETGEPIILPSYDPRQYRFAPSDFIGLTRGQAQRLAGQAPPKPAFHIDRTLLSCPTTPRSSINGCGSKNLSEVDDEGLIDCFDCGIWFDPLREPSCLNALAIVGGTRALQEWLDSLPEGA